MRIMLIVIGMLTLAQAAPRARAVELFWNDDAGIFRRDRDGPADSRLLYETFETRGIAVNVASDRLLWSDILPIAAPLPGGVIRAGNTHGGTLMDVARHLPSPAGVAFDARSKRLYWTDRGDINNPSAVFSANLDGSEARRIISGDWLAEIAGIALDEAHGKLYFSYDNPLIDSLYTGGIARANLDGSNAESVIGGLGRPLGVAVDPLGDGLYWADARGFSAGGGDGRIEAASLDGQERRIILGGLDVPYGVALDLERRDIYWTDMGTGKIQRTAMSGILPFFQDVLTGLSNPTAIAIPCTAHTPGDANDDGLVDRADAATLAGNYGRSGPGVSWYVGDFNGDRLVSLADLSILQAHFHAGADATSTFAAVPEPSMGILAALGMLFVVATSSRCRRGGGRLRGIQAAA